MSQKVTVKNHYFATGTRPKTVFFEDLVPPPKKKKKKSLNPVYQPFLTRIIFKNSVSKNKMLTMRTKKNGGKFSTKIINLFNDKNY